MTEKKDEGDGLGISGFTLGVLSIIFAGWIGIIIAIVGGSFCLVQQNRKKIKLGKIGLILNIIGLVFSIVYIVWLAPLIEQYLAGIAV